MSEENKAVISPASKPLPELEARVKAVFIATVKSQIGGNRKHGWGVQDSSDVIEALIMDNSEAIGREKSASVELMKYIRMVINPSAFRQILESDGALDKSESKKEKREKMFENLTE